MSSINQRVEVGQALNLAWQLLSIKAAENHTIPKDEAVLELMEVRTLPLVKKAQERFIKEEEGGGSKDLKF